jgi:Holliday junction resolvase RusA-like endonuclease
MLTEKMLCLFLDGKPTPGARPRRGMYGNFYNPHSDDLYRAKKEIKKQLPIGFPLIKKEIPIYLKIYFYFLPNKKESKVFSMADIVGEEIPYIKKPDSDNIEKFAWDSLTGTVFTDDSQIYHSEAFKFYSDNPRTSMLLYYSEEESE